MTQQVAIVAAGLETEAAMSRAHVSEDAKEGFTAFLEKRPPIFTGKAWQWPQRR